MCVLLFSYHPQLPVLNILGSNLNSNVPILHSNCLAFSRNADFVISLLCAAFEPDLGLAFGLLFRASSSDEDSLLSLVSEASSSDSSSSLSLSVLTLFVFALVVTADPSALRFSLSLVPLVFPSVSCSHFILDSVAVPEIQTTQLSLLIPSLANYLQTSNFCNDFIYYRIDLSFVSINGLDRHI